MKAKPRFSKKMNKNASVKFFNIPRDTSIQTLEYIHTNGVYDINLHFRQFSCAPIHHITITPIKLYFTSARLCRCTGPTDSPVQKYSGLRCLILCQRFSDSCIL